MKLLRFVLTLSALAVVVGVAYVGQATESTGTKMADAADRFLTALTPEQKAKATFAFDDKERFNWHFTPYQDREKKPRHKGVPLKEMTEEQKDAARALLRAGTSPAGNEKATSIMSLESILADLEQGRGPARDPELYFFTVYGKPSKTGKWGWRVEGHHLSLNFTLDKGKVISATPSFFGANPAIVMAGDHKGKKTLAEVDAQARELFTSLEGEQKAMAYQKMPHPEIAEATRLPTVGEPQGLPASKMTEKQRGILVGLIETYARRMPADVAERALKDVKAEGIEKVHFAYAGGADQGEPRTYRVQGPTFVIEYLNIQPDSAKNPANHIHSAWRDPKNDFGLAGE